MNKSHTQWGEGAMEQEHLSYHLNSQGYGISASQT